MYHPPTDDTSPSAKVVELVKPTPVANDEASIRVHIIDPTTVVVATLALKLLGCEVDQRLPDRQVIVITQWSIFPLIEFLARELGWLMCLIPLILKQVRECNHR